MSDIKSKLDDLKKANESDDIEKIKKSVEDLNSSWQKVSQQMYQEAQSQQDSQTQTGNDKKENDDVQDADYEVVEDDEKK